MLTTFHLCCLIHTSTSSTQDEAPNEANRLIMDSKISTILSAQLELHSLPEYVQRYVTILCHLAIDSRLLASKHQGVSGILSLK